ncbi:MAG: glycosyltransferase family 39 protein [Anaerolineae bacterium]|nr:glycosyltransferase family 39 protein [Anaerolineae bacterium]
MGNLAIQERHQKPRGISLERLALFGILFLGFAVRVWLLDAQGMWRDEVDALNFAMAPLSEMIANFTRAGWNGPLYFLLLRGWAALTGATAFALRFFSVLMGLLELAVLFDLTRRRIGPAAAVFTLGVAACSPYLVWYAAEVKMYTWVPFLAVLALGALDRACEHPQGYLWATVLVATTLAIYSHILAALLIPVEIAWFILYPRRASRAWRGALVTLVLLTLPYLPLLAWQFPLVLQDRGTTGFPEYTLFQMLSALLVGWSVGPLGWGMTPGLWIFGGLALLGGVALGLSGKGRVAATLAGWLLVPLLLIWAISQRGPIFTDRYLIWTTPAFYMAIGAALAWIGQRGKIWVWGGLLALVVLDGGNLVMHGTQPYKPQFREAAAYLRLHRLPSELLLFQIPYNHRVIDYYLDAPLDPWYECPYTNHRGAGGDYLVDVSAVDAQLRAHTSGYSQVWLVYSEFTLWDERELVKSWLDGHGVLTGRETYHGVTLYAYRLPVP